MYIRSFCQPIGIVFFSPRPNQIPKRFSLNEKRGSFALAVALYAGVAPASYRRVNCIQSVPCNGKMGAKIRREKSSRVFDADALFITVV